MKKRTYNEEFYVDFDFVQTKYGIRNMSIKGGFKTREEAQRWADENTTDGIVGWMADIEF